MTVGPDGSVSADVPVEQGEAYDAATIECRAGLTVEQFEDYSVSQRHDLYDNQVALRDCIVGFGVELPAAPSYPVFEEGGGVWTPYLDVPPDVVSAEGADLQEQCPSGQ